MKCLPILALLLGMVMAYRKSHSHRSRHTKCPDWKKKKIPSSDNIHESPYIHNNEGHAKMGQGAYTEESLKHMDLVEPIKVARLYNQTVSRHYKTN